MFNEGRRVDYFARPKLLAMPSLDLWRFGQDPKTKVALLSEEETRKARQQLQEKSSQFHNIDLQHVSPAELGELRSRHNIVYRNWSYRGKLRVGEHVDLDHCLPNRMHFNSVTRFSPEAASLPPTFAKIPPHTTASPKDYVKEVKEIVYLIRPDLKPKPKIKTAEGVSADQGSGSGLKLAGRTPGGGLGIGNLPRACQEPELDDEGICRFAQEVLTKSKCGQLVDSFRVLDANGSDELSLSEFQLGLKAMDVEMDKDETRRIFKWLDMDKRGSISLSEWNRLDTIIKMLRRSGKYLQEETDSQQSNNLKAIQRIERQAAIAQTLQLTINKKLFPANRLSPPDGW